MKENSATVHTYNYEMEKNYCKLTQLPENPSQQIEEMEIVYMNHETKQVKVTWERDYLYQLRLYLYLYFCLCLNRNYYNYNYNYYYYYYYYYYLL